MSYIDYLPNGDTFDCALDSSATPRTSTLFFDLDAETPVLHRPEDIVVAQSQRPPRRKRTRRRVAARGQEV